jgi:hypothetical protein
MNKDDLLEIIQDKPIFYLKTSNPKPNLHFINIPSHESTY